MVIQKDEEDKRNEKEKQRKLFEKQRELQKFQKIQMGVIVPDSADPREASLMSSSKKKRGKVGGPMNVEEIRMNKELLKEISKLKKEAGISRVGTNHGFSSAH